MKNSAIIDPAGGTTNVLVKLAWPLVLMGLIDYASRFITMIWIGRLIGVHGLAVGAIWAPVGLGLYFIIWAVPQGATALIAPAIAKNPEEAGRILNSAISLQILVSVGLTIAVLVALPAVTDLLLGTNYDLADDLWAFSFWAVLSLVPRGFVFLLLTAIYATGNTQVALIRSIVSLIFFVAAVPVLIEVFKLGIASPQIAGLAFFLLLGASLGMLMRRKNLGIGGLQRGGFRNRSYWGRILKIGVPPQFARIFGYLVLAALVGLAAADGVASAAAFGIMYQLAGLVGSVGQSLGRAAGIATGQNIGSSQPARAIRFAKVGVLLSLLSGLVFFALTPLAEPLVRLFTTDDGVVAKTMEVLMIVRWGFLLRSGVQVLFALYAAVGNTTRASLLFAAADIIGAAIAFSLDSGGLTAATWGLTAGIIVRFVLLSMLAPLGILRPISLGTSRVV